MRDEFTLSEFMNQMGQITKLGPMSKVIGMIPGMSAMTRKIGGDGVVEKQTVAMRAIYDSMNKKERAEPDLLDSPRRRRIAGGAGVDASEVSQFMRQFETTRDMMPTVGRTDIAPKLKWVLGLITNDPLCRDPSYVYSVRRREWWRHFLGWSLFVALCAVVLAVFRYFH